jgi:hypothetical protein
VYATSVSEWFRGFREMVSLGGFLDRFRPVFRDAGHTAGLSAWRRGLVWDKNNK